MAIKSKISSGELSRQVSANYVGETFEVALINSPGTSYQPDSTDEAAFISYEVGQVGGYRRQTLFFTESDVSNYSDGGVALATKAAVFAHDGSPSSFSFTHVALVRGEGNVEVTNSVVTSKPSAGVNGSYLSLPTTTAGGGYGLTVNLTVTNSGTALTDWILTIANPGYGYADGEGFAVTDAVLAASGAIAQGSGDLLSGIGSTSSGGGAFVSVAPTTNSIVMSDGNEAVFYFNLKQFGFN